MSRADPPPIMVAPFRLDSLQPDPAAPPPRGQRGTTGPARRRHRGRRRRVVALFAVVVLAVVGVVAGVVAIRLHAPPPAAAVRATMPATVRVGSPAVTLPWPTTGQSAIAVPSLGIDVASGPEQSVPVASLTKMMTAYVILHDHPLTLSGNGPSVTMTQADVDYYDQDTVEDEANAEVTLGEVLTERQLMEGLLVHSANNFALTLARWDAGSVAAFVAKMNRTAKDLGMDHTHYADPSGFDEASQSTASDLLKLAVPDMAIPAFAAIVRMTSVTLPVAGTISTYTPLLGFQGVLGVKSGFTTAAGGCDVSAVVREVHGEPVLILSAVTGQVGPNVLGQAGLIALNLVNHAATSIASTPLVRDGQVVARVSVAGHTVAATAAAPADLLTWPGVVAKRAFVESRTITAGAKKGSRIGSILVALGTQRAVVPVVLGGHLPKLTMLQRLF